MALPKEPRQKMINIMYLVLTAILALNVSAEILEAFKTVDTSLRNSSANIDKANTTVFESLKAKLDDPQSREKAQVWSPKADSAKMLSDEMDKYINDLKLELKKAANLVITSEGKEDFKEDNLDASTRLFETNGEGKKLEAKLKAYKEAILNLHPDIRAKYEKTLPVDIEPPIGQEGTKKDFTTAYFHMTPTVAALTMLSKFQNNIKNAENQVVTFCHEQIGAVKFILNKFEPIAVSSSTYIMPGQELTVTAGVGAFNDAAKPQITIGGTSVALNDKGVAEKKFNASGSGNQKIHVVINYTNPSDGSPGHLEKDVEYTVGIPGGAAVMLDKMNVFYIGVDNPVTIGSPVGWDKTTVSMNGGTISGSGSNRMVRVTTPGTASITVNADNHPSNYSFRVKRIPDPIFKIGSGKVRMTSVEFKSQSYCRAELEAFDFEAKYSVNSATVYFSGANFPNAVSTSISSNNIESLRQYINRCGPGSVVTFENVKVTGPDGGRVIEGKSIALY